VNGYGTIRCKLCDEVIQSTHRHDFRSCTGGHVFVDGGRDYLRFGTLKPEVTDADYEILVSSEGA
jgi:hypothetical protein